VKSDDADVSWPPRTRLRVLMVCVSVFHEGNRGRDGSSAILKNPMCRTIAIDKRQDSQDLARPVGIGSRLKKRIESMEYVVKPVAGAGTRQRKQSGGSRDKTRTEVGILGASCQRKRSNYSDPVSFVQPIQPITLHQ
jgi:hypothetical protein